MSISICAKKLQQQAQAQGLNYLGISDLTPLDRGRKHLSEWQAAGLAAEMSYMMESPERLSSPALLEPRAKSAALFAIYYDQSPLPPRIPDSGRVARYAWGHDYHRVLPLRLKSLVRALEKELCTRIFFKIHTDAVPILEREWAGASGLGFFGKNTLLIQPRRGSYFFIAEILWDLEVEGEVPQQKVSHCGECVKCMAGCPTEALIRPYVLDARRCISYLTIEKQGVLERGEASAIGEWVFGCDVCQDLCPFNHTALKLGGQPDLDSLSHKFGVGAWLELELLLAIRSAHQFRKRFGESALMRAGRENMLRNALAVALNLGIEGLLPQIEQCALEDKSEVVRAQALWSLCGFGAAVTPQTRAKLKDLLKNDSSPFVQSALVSMM